MLLSKYEVWMFIFVILTEAQVRKDKLEIENTLDIEVILSTLVGRLKGIPYSILFEANWQVNQFVVQKLNSHSEYLLLLDFRA